MSDTISRQAAIDRINKQREHLQPDIYPQDKVGDAAYRICAEFIERLPSVQPERKKMSNKEWVDFLSEQFTVSRTSAREMLHGLMKWKAEDNFKKQYSGGRNEKE